MDLIPIPGNKTPEMNVPRRRYFVYLLYAFVEISLAISAQNFSIAINCMTAENATIRANWTLTDESTVLSMFGLGSFIFSFPVGLLAYVFGVKIIVTLFLAFQVVCNLLVPVVVKQFDSKTALILVCIMRFLVGITDSLHHPVRSAFCARWTTKDELLHAIVMFGICFHSVSLLTSIFSGLLCDSSLAWPSVFYISGGIIAAFLVLWMLTYTNEPFQSKILGNTEKLWLKSHVLMTTAPEKSPFAAPWKAILISGPVWALAISQLSEHWQDDLAAVVAPVYWTKCFGLSPSLIGLFSAAPVVAIVIGKGFASLAAKFQFLQCGTNITYTMKVWNSLAFLGCFVFTFILAFIPCSMNPVYALIILISSRVIFGFSSAGWERSDVLITPHYASVVSGLACVISQMSHYLDPLTLQLVGPHPDPLTPWSTVFFIAAGMCLLGATIFLVFGSGELQEWDNAYSAKDRNEIEVPLHDFKDPRRSL